MANATPDIPVPSLAVALNSREAFNSPEAWVDIMPVPSIGREEVKVILSVIWNRLGDGPAGIQSAWNTTEGRGQLTDDEVNSAEEQWARQFTEMLLCTPYSSPAMRYLENDKAEKDLFDPMQRDIDPIYPITTACQQGCTTGAIVRGFKMDGGSKPYFQFTDQSKATVKALGGDWVTDPQWRQMKFVTDQWQQNKEPRFGPGTVFVFNAAVDHIAMVIRATPGRDLIQLFDTGGMQAPEPEPNKPKVVRAVYNKLKYFGNYDYGWAKDVRDETAKKEYGGMGLLPVRTPQDLLAGVARLRVARPLGLARLVLRERATGRILFASPLLFMHDVDSTLNFSMARYLWSLRCMPGRDKVKGTWIIHVPKGAIYTKGGTGNFKFARTMAAAGRTRHLSEILEDTYGMAPIPGTLKEWGDADHPGDVQCIEYLSTAGPKTFASDKDVRDAVEQGLVFVEHIRTSSGSNIPNPPGVLPPTPAPLSGADYALLLPWNRPSGSVQLTREDFNDFPYFLGEWNGENWNTNVW